MPRLRETQRLFWRLIRAPEGVAAALRALPDAGRVLPGGLEGWIHGDERLGAAERLEVYANMYFFRLLECLEEDFPAVAAVVGHEAFHGLAADYLDAHPSEHPSVRMLGRSLGDFLERHALCAGRGWLADLARFEWALLEAFDAPDRAPLGSEALAAVAPDGWAELRIELTPSLRLLEARAAVDDAWSAATAGSAMAALEARPTPLRVWREGLAVFHRRLDAVELTALRAIAGGERFAAVCEAAAAVAGEEQAAAAVVACLRRWLADGMIVGLRGTSP
jgi:hypothetical protein